jgi:hypothetical protein
MGRRQRIFVGRGNVQEEEATEPDLEMGDIRPLGNSTKGSV